MVTSSAQLRTLVWKSWILKKAEPKSTCCEFFLPFFGLLLIILLSFTTGVSTGGFPIPATSNLMSGNVDPWIYSYSGSVDLPFDYAAFFCTNQRIGLAADTPAGQQLLEQGFQSFLTNLLSTLQFLPSFAPSFPCGNIVFPIPDPTRANIKAVFQDLVQTKLFKSFASDSEITSYVTNDRYSIDADRPRLGAAIILHEDGNLTRAGASGNRWSYTIRYNATLAKYAVDQETDDYPSNPTLSFYSFFQDLTGIYFYDAGRGSYQDTVSGLSVAPGFLQYALERFLLVQTGVMTSQDLNPTTDSFFSTHFLPFPSKAGYDTSVATGLMYVFVIFMLIFFMWPFSRLVRNLVEEKELRARESLRMMGVSSFLSWFSWFVFYFLAFFPLCMLFAFTCTQTLWKNSSGVLVFTLFALFITNLLLMGFVFSAFFDQAKNAGTISPFLLLISFLPYIALVIDVRSSTVNYLLCLVPPVAFQQGVNLFFKLDLSAGGLTFSRFTTSYQNASLAGVFGMMFLDVFVYTFLAWYFDKVVPSEFGTAEKPWFCLTRVWWQNEMGWFTGGTGSDSSSFCADSSSGLTSVPLTGQCSKDCIEPIPGNIASRPGVNIRDLRKQFYNDQSVPFWAVKGVELSMHEGEIFVLLGHNGAGKTTLMSMLTGLLPPTGGSATLFGHDLVNELPAVRKLLGVCPQHDILWPTLSMQQHLHLVGALKGYTSEELERYVSDAVREVDLGEKFNSEVSSLSGGQKRRLSLAMALLGDSKVVFLDEPTSGVDVSSRRAIWDLLLKKKPGRVIVLSTHFMDEADQLGDRIGILHHGVLQCCGSSLFLKSRFGVGYTLTLSKHSSSGMNVMPAEEQARDHAFQNLVTSRVPDSQLLSNAGTELSFRLPLNQSARFPALLRDLDDAVAKPGSSSSSSDPSKPSGLASFGLSVTTMEDVFIRVAHQADEDDVSAQSLTQQKNSFDEQKICLLPDTGLVRLEDFSPSIFRQFLALLAKRFHVSRRDLRGWICQFFVPIALLATGLILTHISGGIVSTETLMSAAAYNSPLPVPVTFNSSVDDVQQGLQTTISAMQAVASTSSGFANVNPFALGPGGFYIWNNFSSALAQNTDAREQSVYGALAFQPNPRGSGLRLASVWTNRSACHGFPVFINLGHNTLLRASFPADASAQLSLRLQPFPLSPTQLRSFSDVLSVIVTLLVAFAFSFVPSPYAAFVVRERETRSKHLQTISGVNLFAYWGSCFVFDVISFMLPAAFTVVLIQSLQSNVFPGSDTAVGPNSQLTFTSADSRAALIDVFIVNGLSVVPFAYLVSFLFDSHSRAQNMIVLLSLVSGLICGVISILSNITHGFWFTLFSLFPNYQLTMSVAFVFRPSILAANPSSSPATLIAPFITTMIIEAVVYFALVLFIDWARSKTFWNFWLKTDPIVYDPANLEDDDVRAERGRMQQGQGADDLVQVRGLRKSYDPDVLAVKDLWFGIPRNECFGFLGVNGAGKTTALRMLCGDEAPSRGQAFLNGLDSAFQSEEVRRLIGYCPQFDALHELMTAREHLFFYGRLRGVPESLLPSAVDRLLDSLSLQEYADRPSGGYSGGNKRKLSVAIALIGNPPIVFLDEPSTGVDPVSKRLMWNFISSTSQSRAVILTTHSMEEAEALCQRIGIFVAGQLRCLASPQRLKHVYGRGLQIDLAVADEDALVEDQKDDSASASMALVSAVASPAVDSEAVRAVRDLMKRSFGPHASLIEHYQNRLKFRVEAEAVGMKLSDVFELIEQNRKSLRILEYSVGQATLEQVFLSFARGTAMSAEEAAAQAAAQAQEQRELAAYGFGSAIGVAPAAPAIDQHAFANFVCVKYQHSLDEFLRQAMGSTPIDRVEALVKRMDEQMVDLESVVLLGSSGWQMPPRYASLQVPLGVGIKIAARLQVEEREFVTGNGQANQSQQSAAAPAMVSTAHPTTPANAATFASFVDERASIAAGSAWTH